VSRIVVVGGGGHAKVVISVLRRLSWDVAGYTDTRDRGVILGVARVGDDSALPGLLEADPQMEAIIGIGKVDASRERLQLQDELTAAGLGFPAIVSPRAVVNEEVTLGPGTVVLDGAVVNSGTVTGRGCIFNTNSTVDHDCRIGHNVHVAPGATVSGGANVGDDCMIGAGATLIHGVTICPGTLVGAGAAVVGDIETPGTYVGVPARRTT
jgi:sugar O-acyltransferase (sialic acid O-acetyltransferase NeuD family)